MSNEGKLETQCWICPICYDDHRYNEDMAFCKTEDLLELRNKFSTLETELKNTVPLEFSVNQYWGPVQEYAAKLLKKIASSPRTDK